GAGLGRCTTGGSRSGATATTSLWRTTAALGAAGPRACTVWTELVRASAWATKKPAANSATPASPARIGVQFGACRAQSSLPFCTVHIVARILRQIGVAGSYLGRLPARPSRPDTDRAGRWWSEITIQEEPR